MFCVMIRYSRDIIEDRISGKSGRPRQKTLDWIIDKVNGKRTCTLRKNAVEKEVE